MSKYVLGAFLCLLTFNANAEIINANNYNLTRLTGSFSYGGTNWNGYHIYGTIDSIEEFPQVESILSDGYVPVTVQEGLNGAINGIYSGYPYPGFHSIEFAFTGGVDFTLDYLSFLSSRANFAAITLEYAINGGGWQVATRTSSSALGMSTGDAQYYNLSFGGVSADAFRITLNGDQISLHEVKISSVPIPAAIWLFGSGLISLIGIARRKKV